MFIVTQFKSKRKPNWILIETKAAQKSHQIESKSVPLLFHVYSAQTWHFNCSVDNIAWFYIWQKILNCWIVENG